MYSMTLKESQVFFFFFSTKISVRHRIQVVYLLHSLLRRSQVIRLEKHNWFLTETKGA